MHWSTEHLQPMNSLETCFILAALLAGPLIFAPLEHNLEPYCFALGMIAVTVSRQWEWHLLRKAALDPMPITITVVAAGMLFSVLRPVLDRSFGVMRRLLPRPLLAGLAVLIIGLLSSAITAVVAALMLVEGVALMGLGPTERARVVVLGCFAIGLGSALTPIGGPLAALAASAMDLNFADLFKLLSLWVFPGVAAVSLLSAYYARGPYDLVAVAASPSPHERTRQALMQGLRIFAFIAGLILIGEACAPLASRYVGKLSDEALFWANTISAALDNSTLVAIEFHQINRQRAQAALLSLLISGGMLIPGNVPNIVCANKLGMRSGEWARIGLPLGLIMLGIYFAVLLIVS
jgi:predicted cation transporter